MKLQYPLDPPLRITQTFAEHEARAKANGWCPRPGTCPSGIYYFGGIDYGVPIGTPVKAALTGRVTVARADNSGYGTHIRILTEEEGHDWLAIYGHMSDLDVQVGYHITAGDVVGLSGNTGNSSGPHLHFELRRDSVPVDPQPYFAGVTPPQPPVFKLPEIPDLPMAVCRAEPALNIRTAPSTNPTVGNDIGDILQGERVLVFGAVQTGYDWWFHVIANLTSLKPVVGYAAALWNGHVYLEVVE